MTLNPLDQLIKQELNDKLKALEQHFEADFLSYYGPIYGGLENTFLQLIEALAADEHKKNRLCILLTTGGGSAEVVERCVNIIRNHYNEVYFIVPDYAYSAGTIFCMSGDRIYMDYYSVLGPIDPQVMNKEGKWVAALGYLDKINELIVKAQNGSLTNAEFVVFKDFDLAEIKGYEQAKELTISLLKNWLVQYKFQNWNTHRTTRPGTPVTHEEKIRRAEEIATILNETSRWKTHGRPINIKTLREMRLDIEDYGTEAEREKSTLIRSYYHLLANHIGNKFPTFVHTRNFI
jgi:hypothetical protein